jgi:hypothetical protein
MPFQTPWRGYHSGDLLFGLACDRHQLAETFGISAGNIYTIDQYGLFSHRGDPRLNTHRLHHDPAFISALRTNAKTAGIVDTDLNDDAAWSGDRAVATGAIARRKCKSGIEYICLNTQHHIHFCLRGLDLTSVAIKSHWRDSRGGQANGIAWDGKSRSITNAELRRIYRRRLDPRIAARIQFWKQDGMWEQCPPPWNDPDQPQAVQRAFAAYVPAADRMDVDVDEDDAMDRS